VLDKGRSLRNASGNLLDIHRVPAAQNAQSAIPRVPAPPAPESGNAQRSGGAKQAWNGPGELGSLCNQMVTGRYPFTPDATNSIPLDDFAFLFSPNGMINTYFNMQIRPFVDTSGPIWKAQPVAGVAPPVSPSDLAQYQRAAAIGEVFFAGGATQPTLGFSITPATLDDRTKEATLDLDGVTVTNTHGPERESSVTWPGPTRMNSTRLVFKPAPAGGGVLQASGAWALFRLFDQGKLTPAGSSDVYTLSFHLGDRHATLLIRADWMFNPFAPGMLHDFRCPSL
jgi:type VI secretion system protein ImpL